MKSRLRLLAPALRELGIGSLSQYGIHQLQLRSGLLKRRTPPYHWADRELETWLSSDQQAFAQKRPFFFQPGPGLTQSLSPYASEGTPEEADEILTGRYRLFGGPPIVLGNPPNWGMVPLMEQEPEVPLDRHWTTYDASRDMDFRLLWEPGRFGWAYTLCRAHWLTGDRKYADGAVTLWESWQAANAPNLGPHWMSGQEIALRAMTMVFMWFALADIMDEPTAANLAAAIAAHADRLPHTLSYSRAQRNNHILVEAAGLYTVGLLFPELRDAGRWRDLGRRELIAAIEDQVFEDGGYIQYSANYQRLALSACLWCARLSELSGDPLPPRSIDSIRRMTQFLIAFTDPNTGKPPNWGHNDGSNILPLSSSPHDDYRTVLQAAARAFLGGPAYGPGPWDEASVWLGVLKTEGRPPDSVDTEQDFPEAGLYIQPGKGSRATLRAVNFTARPSHSDQLHVDLWWQQQNVVRDAGTYRYTATPPWENAFAAAKLHNTVTADGHEPMDRGGRFLWLNWSAARFLGRWQAPDGSVAAVSAEHRIRGSLTHRRTLLRAGSSLWVVLDELLGTGSHQARVAWSTVDWEWKLEGQILKLNGDLGPLGVSLTSKLDSIGLYRAGEQVAGQRQEGENGEVLGWWSPTYGHKEPALTLVGMASGRLPLRITSWWRLGKQEPEALSLESGSLHEDPLLAFLSTETGPLGDTATPLGGKTRS